MNRLVLETLRVLLLAAYPKDGNPSLVAKLDHQLMEIDRALDAWRDPAWRDPAPQDTAEDGVSCAACGQLVTPARAIGLYEMRRSAEQEEHEVALAAARRGRKRHGRGLTITAGAP